MKPPRVGCERISVDAIRQRRPTWRPRHAQVAALLSRREDQEKVDVQRSGHVDKITQLVALLSLERARRVWRHDVLQM